MSNVKDLIWPIPGLRVTKCHLHQDIRRWNMMLTKKLMMPSVHFYLPWIKSDQNFWVYVDHCFPSVAFIFFFALPVLNQYSSEIILHRVDWHWVSSKGERQGNFLGLYRTKRKWCKFFFNEKAVKAKVVIIITFSIKLSYSFCCNLHLYSWEQWHLRVVVNNTPRPVSDDSAAVIERQRIQVRFL